MLHGYAPVIDRAAAHGEGSVRDGIHRLTFHSDMIRYSACCVQPRAERMIHMNKKGQLIVISGFSGAGKGTVVKELVGRYGYSLSISATTRAPRPGEVDGKDYYFKKKSLHQEILL